MSHGVVQSAHVQTFKPFKFNLAVFVFNVSFNQEQFLHKASNAIPANSSF